MLCFGENLMAKIGCLLHILNVVANNGQCTYSLAANYCDNLLIRSAIYLHVGVALCRRASVLTERSRTIRSIAF